MKSIKWNHILIFFLLHFALVINISAQIDQETITEVISKWNNAHNKKSIGTFERLYSTRVIFYGQELSREQSVLKKSALLAASTDFSQEIVGPIKIQLYDSNTIKCQFNKLVHSNGKITNYPAYLLLKKHSGEFFVCGESDEITDSNLRYELQIGKVVDTKMINELTQKTEINVLYYGLICGIAIFVALPIIYLRHRIKRKSATDLVQNEMHETDKDDNVEHNENMLADVATKQPASPKEDDEKIKKGLEFEKFVVSQFDERYFTLIDWRGDKGSKGIYPQSNGNPDLVYNFKYHFFKRQFAVECKYRKSSTLRDTITIAKEYQIEKYKRFQSIEKMDVYIVIGLGGEPYKPSEIYLVPLNKVTSSEMHEIELIPFKRSATSRFIYNSELDQLT